MFRISDESYERVEVILEDIGYACDIEEEYQEWEDVARSSFATVMDELDSNQFDMTCSAIRERIIDEYDNGNENYAKGISTAFYGYLRERRDYLDFSEKYDKPELPDDADENETEQYDEAMADFYVKKEYNDCVEKWIAEIAKITFGEVK